VGSVLGRLQRSIPSALLQGAATDEAERPRRTAEPDAHAVRSSYLCTGRCQVRFVVPPCPLVGARSGHAARVRGEPERADCCPGAALVPTHCCHWPTYAELGGAGQGTQSACPASAQVRCEGPSGRVEGEAAARGCGRALASAVVPGVRAQQDWLFGGSR
jgi:hypothetical protein